MLRIYEKKITKKMLKFHFLWLKYSKLSIILKQTAYFQKVMHFFSLLKDSILVVAKKPPPARLIHGPTRPAKTLEINRFHLEENNR